PRGADSRRLCEASVLEPFKWSIRHAVVESMKLPVEEQIVRKLLLAALIAAQLAFAQSGRPVDDASLKGAAKNGDERTTYGFTPGETRYSPLNQINTSNVVRVGLNWTYEIGKGGGNQEATPLFWNGTLFSITNWSVVYAIDARSGKEKWRWDPEVYQNKVR